MVTQVTGEATSLHLHLALVLSIRSVVWVLPPQLMVLEALESPWRLMGPRRVVFVKSRERIGGRNRGEVAGKETVVGIERESGTGQSREESWVGEGGG